MTWIFLVLMMGVLIPGCSSDDTESPVISSGDYTAFTNPEFVPVQGFVGDIMEPFISRDGQYLFYNDDGPSRDIYFAIYDFQNETFIFQDHLAALNTPAVEGVPTLDKNNRFYYISTFNYPPENASIFDTIYVGDFDAESLAIVDNLAVVPNLDEDTFGHLNFDVEVSFDGTILYLVDGVFSGNVYPDESNFIYAVDSGNGFERQADSAVIFANINTSNLEYAACISRDGLEFFFTRLTLATLETEIFRSWRPTLSAPFEEPQKITSISGFVEAPALSADEKVLYYHRRNPVSNGFELYRVRRP